MAAKASYSVLSATAISRTGSARAVANGCPSSWPPSRRSRPKLADLTGPDHFTPPRTHLRYRHIAEGSLLPRLSPWSFTRSIERLKVEPVVYYGAILLKANGASSVGRQASARPHRASATRRGGVLQSQNEGWPEDPTARKPVAALNCGL